MGFLGPELFPKPQSLEVFQQWQFGSPSWQSFMHLALIFIMSWYVLVMFAWAFKYIIMYEYVWNLHRTDWTFPVPQKNVPDYPQMMVIPDHLLIWGRPMATPVLWCWMERWYLKHLFFLGWQAPGITIYIWGLLYIKANNKICTIHTHTHMKTYMTCFPADFCPNGSAQ